MVGIGIMRARDSRGAASAGPVRPVPGPRRPRRHPRRQRARQRVRRHLLSSARPTGRSRPVRPSGRISIVRLRRTVDGPGCSHCGRARPLDSPPVPRWHSGATRHSSRWRCRVCSSGCWRAGLPRGPTAWPRRSSRPPAAGAVLEANPSFQWAPVERAAKYRVQVSTTAAFSSIEYSEDVFGTAATPTSELPLGSLHWRVASIDGARWSGRTRSRSSLASFPATRRSWSPRPTERSSPTRRPAVLSWEPVPGMQKYVVEIDDESTFTGAAATSPRAPRSGPAGRAAVKRAPLLAGPGDLHEPRRDHRVVGRHRPAVVLGRLAGQREADAAHARRRRRHRHRRDRVLLDAGAGRGEVPDPDQHRRRTSPTT